MANFRIALVRLRYCVHTSSEIILTQKNKRKSSTKKKLFDVDSAELVNNFIFKQA